MISEFVAGILTAIIPALMVSALTAFLTVRLSLRQFRKQRWWDRRADAYSEVLEQLATMSFYFEEWWDHATHIREMKDEDIRDPTVRYKEARRELVRVAAGSSYALSDETRRELSPLIEELKKGDPRGNWMADIDRSLGEVKTSLAKVHEGAQKELQE